MDWTKETLKQAAVKEIEQLTDLPAEYWRVTVVREPSQPWTLLVFWDVVRKLSNGKRLCRATGVDVSEPIEVLRKRLRKVFDEPADEVGLYQAHPGIVITD